MEEVFVIYEKICWEANFVIGIFDSIINAEKEVERLKNIEDNWRNKYIISRYKINKCYESYTNSGED